MPETRLILVAPPQPLLLEGLSSGLFAIKSYVEQRSSAADVVLIDATADDTRSLERRLGEVITTTSTPVVVGITTTTATYQSALRVGRVVKEIRQEATVVMGGYHAPVQDRLVLARHHEIDGVIRGEGERPAAALVRNGGRLDQTVPNLTYRSALGPRRTPDAELLSTEELDALDGVYRAPQFQSALGKFGHVTYVSARGCPLACAFCAVASERIRAKSIPCIADDLRRLAEIDGVRRIAIEDNFFAHSAARTVALCEALAPLQNDPRTRFSWDCQTRVESLRSRAVVDAMARAGCDAVYLGVESFCEDQLTFLAKTAQPAHYLAEVPEVVERVLAAGIHCYVNLQVGLPEETGWHHERTLDALRSLGQRARRLGRHVTVFPMLFVIYPGTRHFLEAVTQGVLSEEVFEDFTTWEELHLPIRRWLGFHFAHGTGGVPQGILYAERLRHGQFEVNERAVLSISTYLTELASIEGINLFHYGQHLIRPQEVA